MTDLLLGLGVLLFGAVVTGVVFLAREQKIQPATVRVLAALCGVGLLSMLLTDWPSEVLAKFWADHSVIAGILSTILLVGIVFLAFEDSERRHQELLDASVTAAGIGGVVDHIIDAEIALALLSQPGPPLQWDPNHRGRPLRWLRELRESCDRDQVSGGPVEGDPRLNPAVLPDDDGLTWRTAILDEGVRRLLGGIRDWSPVIRGSRNGTLVLIAIGQIRNDLMALAQAMRERSGDVESRLVVLRQRLRLLAHFMDTTSGARPVRDEVLLSMDPLPLWSDDNDWAADPQGRSTFGKAWRAQLQLTMQEVNRHV